MKIILVTTTEILPFALNSVLDPSLQYCAIVVDEVEAASNFLPNMGYSKNILHPFYELEKCINNSYYNFIVCISTEMLRGVMMDEICKYEKNLDKIINFNDANTAYNFTQEVNLRYYREHFSEIEIIVTGMSYSNEAFIPQIFNRKLMNFACGSQDLYYDYQIAKRVLTPNFFDGGG